MNSESGLTSPWPIDELRQRLLQGDVLHLLTRPKQSSRSHDVREIGLEGLVQDTMVARFGESCVVTRRAIGGTLGVRRAPFPGRARPDIVVRHRGKTHILELKSSRIDYRRFDNVFEGAAFKEFLRRAGDAGRVPWEVEQDLIKLSLYPKLSGDVGCCLFLMVDAYEGPGRSWTTVFQSPAEFREMMRTRLAQSWADTLLRSTTIELLEAGGGRARLITCVVRAWTH